MLNSVILMLVGAILVIASAGITLYIKGRMPVAESELRYRAMARAYVRSIEIQAEWNTELQGSFAKKERAMIYMQDLGLNPEEANIIIEEAVFDMKCDKGEFINEKDITGYPVGVDADRVQPADSNADRPDAFGY